MAASGSDHSVSFVTGVDSKFFPQLFLLMGSARRYCPDLVLHVCDFGLSEPQREFLRRKNMLLERPRDLPPARFVWDDKASLGQFIEPLATEAVTWIDCDMIIVSDLKAHILALNDQMRESGLIVAAPAKRSVQELLSPELSPHSAKLLSKFDPKSPFMCAGFFFNRSKTFLKAWELLARNIPLEQNYEQYAFMITTFMDNRFKALNYQKWNLSDDYLFAIRLEDNTEKSRILLQDEEIYVIHLTSSNRIRDLMLFQQTFLMGDKKISWNFRLAQHPDLFDFQIGLIRDAMTENFGLLLETGMAEEQG